MVGCPGGVPGTNSGRPRDTWDIWAWFMCKSILKGQNVPGTDGTYHGTDGTCPRDRRDAHQGVSRQNSLCLLVFSFPTCGPLTFHVADIIPLCFLRRSCSEGALQSLLEERVAAWARSSLGLHSKDSRCAFQRRSVRDWRLPSRTKS